MRILIASDSFKGSLSSIEVGEAVAEGIRKVLSNVTIQIIPIADGGEGTVEALVTVSGGEYIRHHVASPLGDFVEARMGMLPDGTAVIEMAEASGLPLVPPLQRNPLLTSTRGTGELLKKALDLGAKRILMGIGGSATNDGGAGAVQALGVRFLDRQGKELAPGGASLQQLDKIDLQGIDNRLRDVPITVICDVDNPLCGKRGASAIYGPQKGATPEMVEVLDRSLSHYASVIKEQLGMDIIDIPGSGAAGGLGGGLLAFTKADLKPGTEVIFETLDIDHWIQQVDLVITGEGRMDAQSVYGKAPKGVADRARKWGKPVFAIVGSVGPGAEVMHDHGIQAIVPIVDSIMNLNEAMEKAHLLVAQATERAFRLLRLGNTLSFGK